MDRYDLARKVTLELIDVMLGFMDTDLHEWQVERDLRALNLQAHTQSVLRQLERDNILIPDRTTPEPGSHIPGSLLRSWSIDPNALQLWRKYGATEQAAADTSLDAYRVGGTPAGRLLTASECKKTYGISGSAIAKLPKDHPVRDARRKHPDHPKEYIYRFAHILTLSKQRTGDTE